MHKYILILLTMALTLPAQAQRRGRGYKMLSSQLSMQTALTDSIERLGQMASGRIDSLVATFKTTGKKESISASADISAWETASLDNPYCYPLFAPTAMMRRPLRQTIGCIGGVPSFSPSRLATFVPAVAEPISWLLAETYALYPDRIHTDISASEGVGKDEFYVNGQLLHQSDKQTEEVHQEAMDVATAPIEIEKKVHQDVSEILDLSDFHIHIRRPNFWNIKGAFSTQFMQYYVSDNWYKGGDNHLSMLGTFNLEANYDNKQKVTFTNKLEAKLGFQTSPSDTYHKFKTNADLLRLTDKLGIQAHSRWYYTIMLQSWTQFYKSFKSNSDNIASDFMSPFESVLSLGMDYKLSKKRVNLTATISPIAANMKYCERKGIVTNHGIEVGKHVRYDLGSTITFNMTLKFCEQVNWVTRLYAFHDYKGHLKAEWENTVNLKVNKYLSTKLFLYPRFDNNVVKKNPEDKYLQFNEYLSVGLDLNF